MKLKRHPLAWAISLTLVPAAWAAEPVELQSVVVSASGLAKQSHEMTTPICSATYSTKSLSLAMSAPLSRLGAMPMERSVESEAVSTR
ncbi:MAG TPA: hypothetical protein DCO74_10550 [Pseudomonas sp.]|nr:hypothetical protein [Pseudomonas sp.]